MPTEFPVNDPRNIWQNQPTEVFNVSLDLIQYKAKQRERKARFEALLSIALGTLLFLFFSWTSIRVDHPVQRLGWAVLSLWCAYFAYQVYRWVWPGHLAADATLATSLDFYRRQLERRRDFDRHLWRRTGLAFCFLGLGMALAPPLVRSAQDPRLLLKAAPFFSLLLVWAVAFLFVRKRARRTIQQEIEELSAFQRQDRS